MSKKVAILEGDKSRRFGGVKYLRTTLTNGNTCEWVPESERKLTTKTVKKNGTYKIADEKPDKNGNKYYGFSQFTVNVKNSTTGKKKPSTGGDGNEYSVNVDDDGNLTETVLPSSIDITTQPTKTTYTNGESISIGGAVVKAYKADGSLWEADGYSGGVIPHDELTLDPTIASGGGGNKQATSDLDTNWQQPINLYSNASCHRQSRDYPSDLRIMDSSIYPVNGAVMLICQNSDEYRRVYFASDHDGECGERHEVGTWYHLIDNKYSISTTERYTYNGKTVYYRDYSEEVGNDYIVASNYSPLVPDVGSVPDQKTLWTAVYGDITGGDSQTITVSWNRPEDEKELTDDFTISVTASGTSDNNGDNNGGAGGGGGGSW